MEASDPKCCGEEVKVKESCSLDNGERESNPFGLEGSLPPVYQILLPYLDEIRATETIYAAEMKLPAQFSKFCEVL